MKLWIDDVRPAPKGWRRVKNSKDAIIFFCDHYDITEVSFDHDLGGDDTVMKLINYLEVLAHMGILYPFKWIIHSDNPVGRKNIELAMKSVERFW